MTLVGWWCGSGGAARTMDAGVRATMQRVKMVVKCMLDSGGEVLRRDVFCSSF